MSDFGGIILFRLPSGANLSIRGDVQHTPAKFSYEKVNNHDGSIDRTVKPEGYEFSLSLRDKDAAGNPVDYDALMALDNVSFSFLHATEKVDRTYSKAKLLGRPQVDAMTGAVSGITGVAEGYLEVLR